MSAVGVGKCITSIGGPSKIGVENARRGMAVSLFIGNELHRESVLERVPATEVIRDCICKRVRCSSLSGNSAGSVFADDERKVVSSRPSFGRFVSRFRGLFGQVVRS